MQQTIYDLLLNKIDLNDVPDITVINPNWDKIDKAVTDIRAQKADKSFVETKIAELISSAPDTLDTLQELAQALGNDPNFAATILEKLGGKVDKEEGKTLTSNDFTDEEKAKLNEIILENLFVKKGILPDGTNLDTVVQHGNYRFKKLSNCEIENGLLEVIVGDEKDITQRITSLENQKMWHRESADGGLSWSTLIEVGDKNAETLDGRHIEEFYTKGEMIPTILTVGNVTVSDTPSVTARTVQVGENLLKQSADEWLKENVTMENGEEVVTITPLTDIGAIKQEVISTNGDGIESGWYEFTIEEYSCEKGNDISIKAFYGDGTVASSIQKAITNNDVSTTLLMPFGVHKVEVQLSVKQHTELKEIVFRKYENQVLDFAIPKGQDGKIGKDGYTCIMRSIDLIVDEDGKTVINTGIRFDGIGEHQTSILNINVYLNGQFMPQNVYVAERVDEEIVINWFTNEGDDKLSVGDVLSIQYYDLKLLLDPSLKGDKGDKGEDGRDGVDGNVSFDELTEAQKESLRGEQGIQGERGEQGYVCLTRTKDYIIETDNQTVINTGIMFDEESEYRTSILNVNLFLNGQFVPENNYKAERIDDEIVITWLSDDGISSLIKDDTLSIQYYDLKLLLDPSLKGDKGDKGEDGTVSFDELTDEQRESLRGETGYTPFQASDEEPTDEHISIWLDTNDDEIYTVVSPKIEVNETDNEVTLTITDVDGTRTTPNLRANIDDVTEYAGLNTENKTVIGAINENNEKIESLKSSVVDFKTDVANAINDKTGGALASTSTKEEYVNAIKEMNIGSAFIPKISFESEKVNFPELPINSTAPSAVVYEDEVHILCGSNSHIKFNGETWETVGTVPAGAYYGNAIVWNGEIHAMGGVEADGSTLHYKFDNSTRNWVSVATLPYNCKSSSCVVYNNEIHLFGFNNSNKHYKFNGTSWVSASTLPYNFAGGYAVVYNDEIHLIGGTVTSIKCHYKFDGTSWSLASNLTSSNMTYGVCVVRNNKIYIYGGAEYVNAECKIWSFDGKGDEWKNEGVLQSTICYKVGFVEYKGNVYSFGGAVSTFEKSVIRLTDSKGWKFYVGEDVTVYCDKSYSLTDGVLSIESDEYKYLTVVKDGKILYIDNTTTEVYLLTGMKLNGTKITQDGVYELRTDIPNKID